MNVSVCATCLNHSFVEKSRLSSHTYPKFGTGTSLLGTLEQQVLGLVCTFVTVAMRVTCLDNSVVRENRLSGRAYPKSGTGLYPSKPMDGLKQPVGKLIGWLSWAQSQSN